MLHIRDHLGAVPFVDQSEWSVAAVAMCDDCHGSFGQSRQPVVRCHQLQRRQHVDIDQRRHFTPSISTGRLGWQKKAFDDIYGNWMGSRPGTSDDSAFIGRGDPQITGRDGYFEISQRIGVDLLQDPSMAAFVAIAPARSPLLIGIGKA